MTQGLTRATTSSLITVAIAGACLGFLPHNFFPARMFMGDSGAMLLGLLLATSTISLTGQIDTSQLADGRGGLVPTVLPLVLPLAILALPFLDLVLAFVRRTYAGKWWFVADKQHLHHRLLERGHSQRRAVLLMYIWSALVSFGVIVLGLVQHRRQWPVVGRGRRAARWCCCWSPWAGRCGRASRRPARASRCPSGRPQEASAILHEQCPSDSADRRASTLAATSPDRRRQRLLAPTTQRTPSTIDDCPTPTRRPIRPCATGPSIHVVRARKLLLRRRWSAGSRQPSSA